MELKFFWRPWGNHTLADHSVEAVSDLMAHYSVEPASHLGQLLCDLLVDDGGLGRHHAVESLAVGIGLATDPTDEPAEWAREYWGATIWPEWTDVMALTDETYRASLATSTFRTILTAWRDFLLAGPDGAPTVSLLI